MEYRQTEHGKIREMYRRQIRSSLKRGHDKPDYSLDEFMKWVLSTDDWEGLYSLWVKSGFNKNLSPSIDRLKNNKGYEFGNIELVTWEINNKRGNDSRFNGVHKTQHRAVVQLSKDMKFVSEFISINEAKRCTGVNDYTIGQVCKGKRKTAGGSIWKYKEDYNVQICKV